MKELDAGKKWGGGISDADRPTEAKRNLLSRRARAGEQIDTAASKAGRRVPEIPPAVHHLRLNINETAAPCPSPPPPHPPTPPPVCIHTRPGHVNVNMQSQGPKY